MKKVIFGGFIFLGGAIMYVFATLGYAAPMIPSHYMQLPQYIGIGAMLVGFALGAIDLKNDK